MGEVQADRLLRWCALAGIDPIDTSRYLADLVTADSGARTVDTPNGQTQPDQQPVLGQILLDVPRSCHFDVCGRWSPAERAAHLGALQRVLAATFPHSQQHTFPFYVQGAHDVATVLLLAVGEHGATFLLQHLVHGQLRGFLQPTMAVPSALLTLLQPLIAHRDAQLAAHIDRHVGGHGVWALSWLLTWFSHGLDSLELALELFERCLAGHPLQALYLSAALAIQARDELLGQDEEGMLMMALQRLPRRALTIDNVQATAALANRLSDELPPLALLALLGPNERTALMQQWPELWWWDERSDHTSAGAPLGPKWRCRRRLAVMRGLAPRPHGTSRTLTGAASGGSQAGAPGALKDAESRRARLLLLSAVLVAAVAVLAALVLSPRPAGTVPWPSQSTALTAVTGHLHKAVESITWLAHACVALLWLGLQTVAQQAAPLAAAVPGLDTWLGPWLRWFSSRHIDGHGPGADASAYEDQGQPMMQPPAMQVPT